MDRIKKARRPVRRLISIIINEVDAALGVDPVDQELLRIKQQELEQKQNEISELDQKVMDALLDADAPDGDIDKESEDIREYQGKLRTALLKIDKAIQPQPADPTPSEAGTDFKRRNFKLPKIELKKFNGDLKEWLGFWSQFKKIDEDDELHSTDKFQYLLQSLEQDTEARDIVMSYPQSAENYPKAVEALKERYGKPNILVQVYVRELLKLTINNVMHKDKIPLSRMHIQLESHLRALESLNLEAADPSTWLFPLVESSLPEEVLRAWQRNPLSKKDGKNENPPKSSLDYLMEFVKSEVDSERIIELARTGFETVNVQSKNSRGSSSSKEVYKSKEKIATAAGLFSGNSTLCIFCSKPHDSKDCGRAQDMSMDEKTKTIKDKKACFICLKLGHGSGKCKAFVKCMVCKQKHVTLMCPELHKEPEAKKTEAVPVENTGSFLNCTKEVLLQTLNVKIVADGRELIVRALCDPGSQKSYIRKKTAEDLGLKPAGQVKLCHYLFGGTSEIKLHNIFKVQIENSRGGNRESLEVLDQIKICGKIPRMTSGPWLSELKRNNIWVPDVGIGCPEIELLIGSDYYGMILTGNKLILQNGLVALETTFGWTVSGKCYQSSNVAMDVTNSMHVQDVEISDLWNLELLGITDSAEHKSKQQKEAETKDHFLKTVKRSPNGRYSVKLPWVDQDIEICNNVKIAEARLLSTTQKLQDLRKFKIYDEIFKEWLSEGIIEEVDLTKLEDKSCYYLPHRAVFKPNSLTTPVRPVFDASCKSKRSPSLNDCLEKGPNLMELIPSILLRFRENQIGILADIKRAFQTIDVEEEDRDVLRFLWWKDANKKIIKIFRHVRVVFGVNSSPFLLAAVLEHHLSQVPENLKILSEKLLKSFYVDNCVTSVHNIEEYADFKEKSTQILADAQMDLRQWEYGPVGTPGIASLSNSGGGLGGNKVTPESNQFTSCVLGLLWNKVNDTLGCDLQYSVLPEHITKRKILSVTQQVFDPIGFSAPALIQPKLLLQEAWAAEVGWDEELNGDLIKRFLVWYQEVDYLSQLSIPRCLIPNLMFLSRSIHVFSDASKDAYGAVAFVRVVTEEGIFTRFLQAKARIAPIKRNKLKDGTREERRMSIPRLELLACVIGTRLAKSIIEALDWNGISCHYWTDSTTALSWIQGNDEWGTFVGNRTREIVSKTRPEDWNHIPGIHNPADLPSRGCSPRQLMESRWWEGPIWLSLPSEEWPVTDAVVDEEEVDLEKKKTTRSLAVLSSSPPWFNPPFSSYTKNVRVMAWIRRVFTNGKLSKDEKELSRFISIRELRQAELAVLRCVQETAFPNGLEDIKGIKVEKNSDGIFRVKTRLSFKKDSTEFRQPIVLPRKHPHVGQLIRHVHMYNCHAGTQFVMGTLREKYWILQTRKAVRSVIQNCVRCKRYVIQNLETDPSPLPRNRVDTVETFQVTGVDLAGPLHLKNGKKVWVVLYTCAVYRAVALDLVESISTEAFLGSLERFIAIYGRPNTIYSDNGTNFTGTVNLFKKLSKEEIEKVCNVKSIQWIFNPPSAPWWGGWWERLIRTAKDLLKRMLGKAFLTYDELRTSIAAVQSTINNRPLTTVTEDEDDLAPLTPAMFMRPIINSDFPESEQVTGRELQKRYKNLQNMKKILQARFRKEYLSLLVQKSYENKSQPPQVGDVVLVGADNKKRFEWPLGRILEVIPGKDGVTRTVKVKTATAILTRPVQRLYPLEIPRIQEEIPVVPRLENKMTEKKRETEIPVNTEPKGGNKNVHEDEVYITKRGRKIVRPNRYGMWNY